MTEEEALVFAICKYPDDDTPRLVYADWLDENGDHTRAAFIRIQCRLARLPEGDPYRSLLVEESRHAVWVYGRKWASALGPGVRDRWHSPNFAAAFHRGFVEEIEMTAAGFLRRAGTLFRRTPLRRVELRELGDRAGALARLPHLARLTTLWLEADNIDAQAAVTVVGSPHLTGLAHLSLSHNSIGPAGTIAVFEGLTDRPGIELEFGGNDIGPAGAAALARSPALTARSALLLAANRIGDAGAATLLTSPHLGAVRRLDLSRNEIGEEALTALVARPRPPLAEVSLVYNDLGNHGARTLAAGGLTGVSVLGLAHNHIGDPGVIALAGGCGFLELRELDLSGNRIGDRGAVALARSSGFPRLHTLDLTGNRIGDEGALAFLDACPPALEELILDVGDLSLGAVQRLTTGFSGRLSIRLRDPDWFGAPDGGEIDDGVAAAAP